MKTYRINELFVLAGISIYLLIGIHNPAISQVKAWAWGEGEYGRVSQLSLTDKDGRYIEVQSGPLPTQSDYGIFAPGGSISWKEYWYPVHGLGVGKSDYDGLAKAVFWKGKTLLAMGKSAEAINTWKTGSELPGGTEEQNQYISLCRSLAR